MYSFEFNGIKSADLGIYILNFDGFSQEGVLDTGGEIVFNTSKPAMSDRWNFHGYSVENPLTTSFQIGKWECNQSFMRSFTREEYAFLKSWLERKDGYRFLRIFKPGYEDTYFNCQIIIKPIQYNDETLGAELSVKCDARYGYSGIQTYETECTNGGSFSIYNDSDDTGALVFDRTEILLTSDATELKIINNLDTVYSSTPYATIICNCVRGEWIQIANRQILVESTNYTTQSLKHNNETIANDFNYKYPRLIHLADSPINVSTILKASNSPSTSLGYNENRINKFTITGGSCKLAFTYRTIRTVIT